MKTKILPVILALILLAIGAIGFTTLVPNQELDEQAQMPTAVSQVQPSPSDEPSPTDAPTTLASATASNTATATATFTPTATSSNTPTTAPFISSTVPLTTPAFTPTPTVEIAAPVNFTVTIAAVPTEPINTTPPTLEVPATSQPAESPVPPPPPPPPPPSNLGQRLIIPSINVDAPIVPVGMNPNTGSMTAPAGWFDIAWYRYGPRPGYPGSAALAGHLDTNTGAPAAFWDLDQLVLGDIIIYQAGNGSQLTFVVDETGFYPWDQVPLDRVFARTGDPRVSLITCGGQWSRQNRNYSHRTIVFAHLQQ